MTRFTIEADQAAQTIDALITRPVEGRDDLRFTLEAATKLEAADWKPLVQPAAATFNRDGTVTRRYADLAPANATLGFLRLRVDLDANRDGKPEATTIPATSARITLRPHHTLEALLPAADLSDDDRLLAYDNAKSTFVLAETDAPLAAHTGLLVKITGSGFTREIRSKTLHIPLVQGTQLITTGSLTSGEVPTNLSEGVRLRLWQPATSDYSSHTLENGEWTPVAPTVKPFESIFLIRSTSLLWQAAP